MPEISEEEYREYIDLKRKETERQERIKELLAQGPVKAQKWVTNLNTIRGYASVFSNVLEEERKQRGNPEEYVLDRWTRVVQYLPSFLITRRYTNKTKFDLNTQFRKQLKKFGWSFKIDYKHGLFIVKKVV